MKYVHKCERKFNIPFKYQNKDVQHQDAFTAQKLYCFICTALGLGMNL